jgi:hypothetical protein
MHWLKSGAKSAVLIQTRVIQCAHLRWAPLVMTHKMQPLYGYDALILGLFTQTHKFIVVWDVGRCVCMTKASQAKVWAADFLWPIAALVHFLVHQRLWNSQSQWTNNHNSCCNTDLHHGWGQYFSSRSQRSLLFRGHSVQISDGYVDNMMTLYRLRRPSRRPPDYT